MRAVLLPALLIPLIAAAPAQAQTYPAKPVRVIVAFPPGGVADVVARVVGQKLSEQLGQSFVVENRPGASGVIGPDVVAKAAPDGHTILITTGDFITATPLMPPMAFDPRKDLVPVAMLATAPLILVANAAAPFSSAAELVAAAKASPGKIGYSSPGTGTINQLACEWLGIAAGVKFLHIPYKGGAPAAVAVAAGDVPLGAVTPSSGLPYINSGKVKVVALMTAAKPSFGAKWPTLAEAGFPVDAALWVAMFAPAGTPAPILTKLHEAAGRALADPNVAKRLNGAGTEPAPMSAAALSQRIAADAGRYADIIAKTGIKIEQ